MENTIDQAVILAGGLGTRFLPATKAIAKEIFPIGNRPALFFLLDEVYRSGIRRVCIVTSKKKFATFKQLLSHDKKLEESLKNLGRLDFLKELNTYIDEMDITILTQGKLNGSGGAVYAAKKWLRGKPFALLFGDDVFIEDKGSKPVTAQLIDVYNKTGKFVIGVKKMPLEVIPRYSCVMTGKKLSTHTFEATDIIEKPQNPQSNFVGLAKYIVTPETLDCLPNLPKFTNGETRFPDAIQILAKQNKVVAHEFKATYYDCGNKLEFTKLVIHECLKDEKISQNLKDYMKDLL